MVWQIYSRVEGDIVHTPALRQGETLHDNYPIDMGLANEDENANEVHLTNLYCMEKCCWTNLTREQGLRYSGEPFTVDGASSHHQLILSMTSLREP